MGSESLTKGMSQTHCPPSTKEAVARDGTINPTVSIREDTGGQWPVSQHVSDRNKPGPLNQARGLPAGVLWDGVSLCPPEDSGSPLAPASIPFPSYTLVSKGSWRHCTEEARRGLSTHIITTIGFWELDFGGSWAPCFRQQLRPGKSKKLGKSESDSRPPDIQTHPLSPGSLAWPPPASSEPIGTQWHGAVPSLPNIHWTLASGQAWVSAILRGLI